MRTWSYLRCVVLWIYIRLAVIDRVIFLDITSPCRMITTSLHVCVSNNVFWLETDLIRI